ncbi:MAG: hypothetical protein ACRDTG_19500 [Pseudonocardiaceae bacterium]
MSVRSHDLDHGQVLAAAKENHDAVIELTRALARIPSRSVSPAARASTLAIRSSICSRAG